MDDAVKARLEALAAANGGRLTPSAVVEDAAAEDSPLHAMFTWDDTRAAQAHRLWEARQLLRRYVIRVEVKESMAVKVPAFVRDPEAQATEQGYVSTLVLRESDVDAREAMRAEVSRLLRHVERMRKLALALGVLDELRGVQTAVEGVLGKLDIAA